MILTINHVKQAKMCTKGARLFFKKYNLDWADFIKNGIDEKELGHIDDAMKDKVIGVAYVE